MTVVESPHVPTRPASDNSNAAASTAYVTGAIATAIAGIVFPNPIPSGTAMVFYQASAPSGWTSVNVNDRAMRVVSPGTTGGTGGGSNAFSTVFAQTVVGSHTLSTAEMPAHTHTLDGIFPPTGTQNVTSCGAFNFQNGGTSGSAGSGGSHNHTITMAITYSDVIICTKN